MYFWLSVLFLFALSANALIQFPKANRDLLIFVPSEFFFEVEVVACSFSDPAKSIINSFGLRILTLPS